eukprot:15437561-Alexandrium_andersonii.AAC.1
MMKPNVQAWTGPRVRAPAHQLHKLSPGGEPIRRDAEGRRSPRSDSVAPWGASSGLGAPAPSPGGVQVGTPWCSL